MRKEKTMKRILQSIGIEEEGIDLVSKVLDLESTDSNVHSIELHHGTIHYNGLWVNVLLSENFPNMEKFQNYLNVKGLKGTATKTTEKNPDYRLYNNKILIEFSKPEYYPKR
ncbi:MAG: hypothetical protein PHQ66_02570 [Candidatus Nanoarchaeia archaeon]|nr:hypothetical protein [Candidatus Nanoarchaeia archaeon]MDD5357749.1 hypothetical protein [Candidatus Nanoarchaeia archaeon]MDD5588668.1 hypothetical protein [Candidatus Nanoarchaeia archaeon]